MKQLSQRKGVGVTASVNYKKGKCHGSGEMSAFLRHADPDPENRKRVVVCKEDGGHYCHINPEMSHYNYVVMMEDNKCYIVNNENVGKSYYPYCWKLYQTTIDHIDRLPTQRNKRKDRLTGQWLEIPFPPELSGTDPETYKKGQIWACRVVECVYEVYTKMGAGIPPLILPGVVHADEIHTYIDAETEQERESVVHLHLPTIPFNTNTASLCGKWFSSRKNMNLVNKAIHEMTKREFGVEFMTGSKQKSRESVDDLKARSAALEAEIHHSRKNLKQQKEKIESARARVLDTTKEVEDTTAAIMQRLIYLAESNSRITDDELKVFLEEIGEEYGDNDLYGKWCDYSKTNRLYARGRISAVRKESMRQLDLLAASLEKAGEDLDKVFMET